MEWLVTSDEYFIMWINIALYMSDGMLLVVIKSNLYCTTVFKHLNISIIA